MLEKFDLERLSLSELRRRWGARAEGRAPAYKFAAETEKLGFAKLRSSGKTSESCPHPF
jgi:hypothetical protein